MKTTSFLIQRRTKIFRRLIQLVAVLCLVGGLSHIVQAQEPMSGAAILQELRSFNEMGSVLHIAAHPDDENTLLLAYLARGKNYRTAYLSITRGDGGQNVLGPEFGEKLGVARTEELLAARSLDGGRQFFTRAIDFGYSKDYRETLNIWNREEVVSDIVRVIRTFRPDVIVTRFSPEAGNTHGHHTASAVLAMEAFQKAGDPKAFPDQLQTLAPWQPKRIMINGRGDGAGDVRLEISGKDPVLGITYGELAAQSRAMHKTQGFGNFSGGGGGTRTETFHVLAGEPATNGILDGVDTTWYRVPGGADIDRLAKQIITEFKLDDPSACVPDLLKLRERLTKLASKDPVVIEKRQLLDRILQHCIGLTVATILPNAEVVPGESLNLRHTALVTSKIPVRWLSALYPSIRSETKIGVDLQPGQVVTRDAVKTLPSDTPLSQPYWLRQEGTLGMFHVQSPGLIGRPENPPSFPVEQMFEVAGQPLAVPDEPMQTVASATEISRHLDVIPPISLRFSSEVGLFAPGVARPVVVILTAYRANVAGTLKLNTPDNWKISPASQPFQLTTMGEQQRLEFNVTGPARPAVGKMVAEAVVGGAHYTNDRVEIHYSHIPLQLLQPVAAMKIADLNLVTRGHKIGYLPGAGDSVDEGLRQMGYQVSPLSDEDLTLDKLKDFDAVVIGVRAFNVRTNLAAQLPGLFAYVEAGGTVVEQYNRPENSRLLKVAPYDLRISSQRVTDENAGITFLAPDHPVLNTPNKITEADFAGWVQERGIYFPDQWDPHFTPIIACNDPGEAPLKGGLLVAQYGKGYFVYTGLVFFRQLPAGVPGAYRLLANLVSLGK